MGLVPWEAVQDESFRLVRFGVRHVEAGDFLHHNGHQQVVRELFALLQDRCSLPAELPSSAVGVFAREDGAFNSGFRANHGDPEFCGKHGGYGGLAREGGPDDRYFVGEVDVRKVRLSLVLKGGRQYRVDYATQRLVPLGQLEPVFLPLPREAEVVLHGRLIKNLPRDALVLPFPAVPKWVRVCCRHACSKEGHPFEVLLPGHQGPRVLPVVRGLLAHRHEGV